MTARRRAFARGLPPMLPAPRRASRRKGHCTLRDGTLLLLPAGEAGQDPALRLAAETALQEIGERTGRLLALSRSGHVPLPGPKIELRIEAGAAVWPRRATARDAYRLRVGSRGIEIAAPDVPGLRHGLQTLCQLVAANGRVPAALILDQPDFRDRGVMLDVSRGKVPTRATLEELVDLCARLRLNVLMLYVEHTFAFRRHPEIGAGVSPLDADTILALDDYAFARGVELVPCLQSLGHMEHVLAQPRYAKLAESDRRWSLSPSRPETYRLLEELYDEFLPLFRSKRVNANCDEPFDLGRGQSAARAPKKSPARLFTDHVAKLRRLAARHDKQLMIWADFPLGHPEEIDRIDRDVVLMDWWYEAEFDFDRVRKLRRKGFEVWACPGTSSWNCLFPRVDTSLRNIERWADAGRRHGASGLLNTDWGDFGHYNALGVSLYAYAWGAQQAWSGDLDAQAFDGAFARRVYGETSARLGRLHRRLGRIHDPGFRVANGSALQYVYFDALDRSFFLQHARRGALAASGRKLDAVLREIEALGLRDAGDDFLGLARQEIAWSAEASRLAVDKATAALEYNAWRADPTGRSASDRRRLARRLDVIADRQDTQLALLTRLWHARSRPSEFHKTRRRIRRSIATLRGGADRLRENRPPKPPRPTTLTMLGIFNEVRRAFGMAPR